MRRIDELATIIAQLTKEDGIHATAVPRLFAARISAPTDPVHGVHTAAICFVAQGAKQLVLGDDVFRYGAAQHLVASVDLPVVGHVVDATQDEPYLCLRLELDLDLCAELLLKYPGPKAESGLGLAVGGTDETLLDAAIRLARLHETPEHIAELAPMIEREIVYRLIHGPQGCCIRRVLEPENRHRHVGRAITFIRENFDKTIRIEDVASLSGMSASSLHQHFREATAMSPLQYQKRLRLQEARKLILSQSIDAATAGHSVGYDSPSQFSREYKRLFGAPPQKDISRLRRTAGAMDANT